jgi:hypothetical protein
MKMQSGLVPRTATAVLRFLGAAAIMFCGVVLLAVAECLVLWQMGFEYTPLQRPVRAAVADFELVHGGLGAVSCVSIRYKASKRPVEYSIVWHDLQTGGRPERLRLDCDPRRIAAPADFAWLAVLETDGAIQMVPDPRRPEKCWTLRGPAQDHFPAIAGAPDGRTFAAATGTQLLVWNPTDGELLRSWPHTCGECVCLAFCRDSRELAAVGANGLVQRWDAATGRLLSTRRVARERIQRAAVSTHGDLICWCSYSGSRIGAVDSATGRDLWRQVEGGGNLSHGAGLAISPDAALVASAVRFNETCYRVVVRDATTGIVTAEIGKHAAYISGLLFDAQGGLYVWDTAGEIVQWDLRTGQETWRCPARLRNDSAVL